MADQPATTASPAKAANLTPRDMQLLAVAIQCVKGELAVQFDFDKFATMANLKNAATARAAWHKIKEKIANANGADGGPSSTPTSKSKSKATPKSLAKKRKAINNGAGSEDELASPSPKKERKTSGGIKKEQKDDWDTEDECDRALKSLVSSSSKSP